MEEFKDIFIELRKSHNWNQEEAAKAIGTSKSSVAMWETGKRYPSREVMSKIANVFNVSTDYLYGNTVNNTPGTGKSINNMEIFSGLEGVRKHPGLYIGDVSTKGLHKMIYEIVDTAMNEPEHKRKEYESMQHRVDKLIEQILSSDLDSDDLELLSNNVELLHKKSGKPKKNIIFVSNPNNSKMPGAQIPQKPNKKKNQTD